MKPSKFFRTAAAVFSAAVMCVAMAGCSIEFGTNPKARDNKIVAKPTAGENTKGMEITYGEFRKQYDYMLNLYEIEDDTDAEIADACTKQRNDIINNLITNTIILHKTQEMGITLTEEDMNEAQKNFDEQIEQQIGYFSGLADYSDLKAEEITEEITHQRGSEELDRFLEECGMTRDDLFTWTKEYLFATKLIDEITKDITREQAETRMQEFIEKIKAIYEKNPLTYEKSGYSELWVPEGSRLIKQVLLGFDESVQLQITTYRNNNDNEGVDKIRENAAKELEEKVAEVQKKLDEMDEGKTTFNEIILEYSADSAGSSANPDGYLVVPNGENYAKEFQEAAFALEKIGDRTVCVTDRGVHVMIYAGDAKANADFVEAFINNAFGEMKNEKFQTQLEEWRTLYNYEIDREFLRLDYKPETSSTSGTSSTPDTSGTSSTPDASGTSSTPDNSDTSDTSSTTE